AGLGGALRCRGRLRPSPLAAGRCVGAGDRGICHPGLLELASPTGRPHRSFVPRDHDIRAGGMNGCMVKYSAMIGALALGWAGVAATAAAQPSLRPPPVNPNPVTEQAIAAASKTTVYPTFAQVPPLPKDVRSISAWKASVTSIKDEGVELAQMAAAEPWTLGDTASWAARERAEA